MSKNIVLFIFLGGFFIVSVNTASTSAGDPTTPSNSYDVIFGWKVLDYKWPSPQTRDRFLQSKAFIPENNIITGVKLWKDRLFLSVPRWREGVPSTLNVVKLDSVGTNSSPPLEPYPSWELQHIGNCSALQFVHSMEIDEFGRMWIIDLGRVGAQVFSSQQMDLDSCPPKVVIIDLETNEIVKTHEFPSDVVSTTNSYLNDIVVGCLAGRKHCSAYITDSNDAKLVVYSLAEDRSWFVQHKTMLADPEATTIPILGQDYTFSVNIDGIALSPKAALHDRVYFTPVSSFSTYSVPTSALHSATNGQRLRSRDITTHTTSRSSQTGGMIMDSRGLLFYVQLQNNSVAYVDTTEPGGFSKENLLIQDDEDLQWPNSFTFDNEGYLYMTTNRNHRFSTNSLDFDEVNFRVVRVFTGSMNYNIASRDQEEEVELSSIEDSDQDFQFPTQEADESLPNLALLRINRYRDFVVNLMLGIVD